MAWAPLAHPQVSTQRPATPNWATAPDRWRLAPLDLSSEDDTVNPAVRAARNSYMLRRLRMVPSSSGGPMIVDYDFGKPDVSPATKEELSMVWVVGTFNSHHVYDADGTAQFLYTEVNFHVDTVIKQPATSSLAAGSVIEMALYGGNVRTKDGVVHSFYLSPSKYALEPSHRYILALWVEPNGIFIAHKQWDVTNGTVQVSSIIDEEHVRTGKSQLVGLSVAGAISFIQNALSPR
jgi:hypothetical protein